MSPALKTTSVPTLEVSRESSVPVESTEQTTSITERVIAKCTETTESVDTSQITETVTGDISIQSPKAPVEISNESTAILETSQDSSSVDNSAEHDSSVDSTATRTVHAVKEVKQKYMIINGKVQRIDAPIDFSNVDNSSSISHIDNTVSTVQTSNVDTSNVDTSNVSEDKDDSANTLVSLPSRKRVREMRLAAGTDDGWSTENDERESLVEKRSETHDERNIETHVGKHSETHVESHIETHVEKHIETQVQREMHVEEHTGTYVEQHLSNSRIHTPELATDASVEMGGHVEVQEGMIDVSVEIVTSPEPIGARSMVARDFSPVVEAHSALTATLSEALASLVEDVNQERSVGAEYTTSTTTVEELLQTPAPVEAAPVVIEVNVPQVRESSPSVAESRTATFTHENQSTSTKTATPTGYQIVEGKVVRKGSFEKSGQSAPSTPVRNRTDNVDRPGPSSPSRGRTNSIHSHHTHTPLASPAHSTSSHVSSEHTNITRTVSRTTVPYQQVQATLRGSSHTDRQRHTRIVEKAPDAAKKFVECGGMADREMIGSLTRDHSPWPGAPFHQSSSTIVVGPSSLEAKRLGEEATDSSQFGYGMTPINQTSIRQEAFDPYGNETGKALKSLKERTKVLSTSGLTPEQFSSLLGNVPDCFCRKRCARFDGIVPVYVCGTFRVYFPQWQR
jgi:hypothetical protein